MFEIQELANVDSLRWAVYAKQDDRLIQIARFESNWCARAFVAGIQLYELGELIPACRAKGIRYPTNED